MYSQNKKITQIKSTLPTVVLFGRVNVGKSTLFNKLLGKSQAMVSSLAGTTRDSNEATVDWQGEKFRLVDAGGIMDVKFLQGKSKLKKLKFDKEKIDTLVQLQIKEQIKRSGLILFLVDGREGLTDQDQKMSILLKRLTGGKTPVILAANKIDSKKQRDGLGEFYSLALGEPLPVSAASGSGVGDLLDIICEQLKQSSKEEKHLPEREPEIESGSQRQTAKIILLGRPNVGKSTLFNAIAGENKVIVSKEPHTTREPSDTDIRYRDKILTFVDTAGIIKTKSKKTKDELIKLGMQKSLAALKRAQIALLIFDISEGVTHQDTKLADEILNSNSSIIIVANKWDKVQTKDAKKYTRYINAKLPFIVWAPIIFLSAKDKTKLTPLLEEIIRMSEARRRVISQEELSNFLLSAARHAPPLSAAKARGIMKHRLPRPKLKKLEQTGSNPPEFTLQIKAKLGLKDNYVKYLENRLRKEFKLVGTPIKIIITDRN